MSGDLIGAESAFRSAGWVSPNWYKPHLVLAEILLQKGNIAEAEVQALKAMDLSGGRHSETERELEAVRRAKH
jgi:hypothetical protein